MPSYPSPGCWPPPSGYIPPRRPGRRRGADRGGGRRLRLGRGEHFGSLFGGLGHGPGLRPAAAPHRGRVLAAPPAVTFPERSGRSVLSMREGNRAVARWPARRFRLASPATALVLGVLTLALIAAEWPFAGLAHLGVNANTGGPQWWVYAPFGVVGFVLAWRKPGNPLGWCLLGMGVTGALSGAGSLYAIAAYRVRPGTLPLGWVAMLAQPGWAITVVLIGLALLVFPDGTLPFARMRWVLWLYLAMALVWMVSAYVITVDEIVRHTIRVDSGGNLLALDNGLVSPGWWNVLQAVLFVALGLSLLMSVAGQVASYRRSAGERRLQLKWLLGGFAAGLAGLILALALPHGTGISGVSADVAILVIFYAVPVSMGVAILKYRLYDIDRVLSR